MPSLALATAAVVYARATLSARTVQLCLLSLVAFSGSALAGERYVAPQWRWGGGEPDSLLARWRTEPSADSISMGRWSANEGVDNTQCLVLRRESSSKATAEDSTATALWIAEVDSLPTERMLRFSVRIRGEGCTSVPQVAVNIFASNGVALASGRSPRGAPARSFSWTHHEGEIGVPIGGVRAELVVALQGLGTIWIDDVEISAARRLSLNEAIPTFVPQISDSGGLFIIESERTLHLWSATPGSDTVSTSKLCRAQIALPLSDAFQVPLAVSAICVPSAGVRDLRVVDRGDGQSMIEVDILPIGIGDSLVIRWQALVLVRPNRLKQLPDRVSKARRSSAVAENWTQCTPCIQCADPRIREALGNLSDSGRGASYLTAASIAKSYSIHREATGLARKFDAVTALSLRGSCLSSVNLLVGLLRANGIQARIVSGVPTWSGAISAHFVAEAFLVGYGWYPIEPTLMASPWPSTQHIRLSVIGPEQEAIGSERLPRNGAHCLPYLASSEFPANESGLIVFGTLDRRRAASTAAQRLQLGAPPRSDAEWIDVLRGYRVRWSKWLKRSSIMRDDSGRIEGPVNLEATRERLQMQSVR